MYKFHKNGSLPQNNEIFVFGSNLMGLHGAGAARQALTYGAKYGCGIGLQGQTYAIPTKDKFLEVLPLVDIKNYINEFKQFTKDHKEMNFFVTAVGTGFARYSHQDIAPLFKGCGENCSFPVEWQDFLTNLGENK